MTQQAAPREIEGKTYPDPVSFVVAGGFNEEDARAVINAYKRFYHPERRHKRPSGTWLNYVSQQTALAGEICMGVMRRYRAFYGKQAG